MNERAPAPTDLKQDIDALETWVSGVEKRRSNERTAAEDGDGLFMIYLAAASDGDMTWRIAACLDQL